MLDNNLYSGAFMKRTIYSNFLLLILAFTFILSGCSSLPMIESQSAGEDPYAGRYYFDVESNIAYGVKHDDEYLYLKLKTDDKTAIRKIMMHGLYVYIDPKAGKSKNIYFNYPLSEKFDPSQKRNKSVGMGQGTQQEFNVEHFLDRVSMEAVFSDHELAEKLPVFSSKTDIHVELISEGPNVLVYYLRMPFDRISKNGLSDISELSLGFMTGKMEMPKMDGSEHSGSGDPSSGGMQGGGGRSAGGMQGGDMQSSGMERDSMMSQLSIWFKIDLSPDNEK